MSRRRSRGPLPSGFRHLVFFAGLVALVSSSASCGGADPDHARAEAPANPSEAPANPGDELTAAKTEPADAEAVKLVEAVLEAYGGRHALEGVEAYRCEGVVTSGQRSGRGETVRWFEHPDRLRIEMRRPDRGDIRIVRGDQGWTGADDLNLVPLGNEFFRSTYLQMVRMGLPLRLADQSSELRELAPDAAGRRVLRLPVAENLSVDCHIDVKTHRIEAVTMNMLDPAPAIMTVELSEFRWVEGVLFPHREDAFSGESETATVRFRTIEVNPITPLLLFAPDGDL